MGAAHDFCRGSLFAAFEAAVETKPCPDFGKLVSAPTMWQLYEMAGTTAIFEGSLFERRFRDARTISQHLQGRISHFETVDKHLLAIEGEPRSV
jgi:hypothetical protein